MTHASGVVGEGQRGEERRKETETRLNSFQEWEKLRGEEKKSREGKKAKWLEFFFFLVIRVWGKSQKGKKEKGEREQEGGGEERKKRQHGAERGMNSSAGILDQSRKNCSSDLRKSPVVWFPGPAYKPTCIFSLTSTPRQSSGGGWWRSASEYRAKTYWGAVTPCVPRYGV